LDIGTILEPSTGSYKLELLDFSMNWDKYK
jgi:hypothetical protein